jgi:DNA replication protein DnaC
MNQPQTMSCPSPSAETVAALCPTHGAYEARLIDFSVIGGKPLTSRCPLCVADAAARREAEEAEQKARERQHRVAGLLSESGIPTRFQARTLDNFDAAEAGQKRALAVCRRYVETWPEQKEKGTSLILSGGPGTGKTHLACAIGSAVIEQHLSRAVFMTVTEALRSIKDTYRKDAESSEQDAINALLRPSLLILDEVGVQVGSDHEKMLMFEILNGRYMECRPTILLSNLSASDLEVYLGQRVMDRYRECGAVIAFDWKSYRGRK